MITFSGLGKRGRLGNQLFQIASTAGIAKKMAILSFFLNGNIKAILIMIFP
jgi:hypothetical protein